MTQCQINGDCPTIKALRSGDVIAAEGVFEFYEARVGFGRSPSRKKRKVRHDGI
jgi:hypothetical protein